MQTLTCLTDFFFIDGLGFLFLHSLSLELFPEVCLFIFTVSLISLESETS